MNTKDFPIEAVIAKTMDSLVGAGLSYQSVWGYYQRSYWMLKAFFRDNGIEHYDIDQIEAFMKHTDERYAHHEIKKAMYQNTKRAVRVLVNYAENGSVDSPMLRQSTHFCLCERYEDILAEYLASREFHPNTQDDVIWAVRRFLYFLEQTGHFSFESVDDGHVRRFILLMSERLASGSLKNMMCYLREFCKYVFLQNYTLTDFSPLFAVKIQRENKIYSCLRDDEVEKILAQINTNTEMGKRDMAMILLGITVGMRSIDIINLRLCDIDWLRGEIHLIQRKTGLPVILPLMPDAGKAIKDYILNARPISGSEFIFLTVKYPIRKLTDDTTLGYTFTHYERMAGIERKAYDGKSFHSLRRKIATKMIVSGVPVTTVSQVLGQAKMDSAKQYISFDMEKLRECAIGFDGIKPAGGVSV